MATFSRQSHDRNKVCNKPVGDSYCKHQCLSVLKAYMLGMLSQ